MKIISIGYGRDIFTKGSEAEKRALDQARLFEELHIIIFSSVSHNLPIKVELAPNCFIYATSSRNHFFYIPSAIKIGLQILNGVSTDSWVVTSQDPFESGLVAWRIAKKSGAKLHFQVHTDLESPYFKKHSFLNRMRVILAHFLLPKANGIRVVSSRIKNSLEKALSFKPARTETLRSGGLIASSFVLPVFVDVEKIKNAPKTTDLHVKYPQFKSIILVAGRLSKEKNISLALQVMKIVVKTLPKAGMIIVGSGSLESRLKLQTINYELQTNVFFEPWTPDIFSYYKTADLFLQTSNFEGNSRALIEAVFSYLPAVATNAGIADEVLKGENYSFVVEVGDVDCLAQKISSLLENKDMRIKVAEENIKRLNTVVIADKQEYLRQYKKAFDIL